VTAPATPTTPAARLAADASFAPRRAVTLLYHDVTAPGAFASSGFRDPLADTYKLTTADFVAHLDAVAAARPDAPGLIGRRAAGPADSPWLISFDDGGSSALAPTADLLEARGWRGHFFISTGFTGTRGFLSGAEVRDLDARGHVVGSHTVTHPARMADLDEASLRREWRDSRRALEDLLGRDVTVASVPGGLYAPHVARAAAAEGIRVLFNSEPTSRVREADGCVLVGRYAFKTTSRAAEAARLAAGDPLLRAAHWVAWNGKKAVKKVSPRGFGAVRALLTGRR
jgi:peptidoglycan/xylan/chitin deacetylase (PgdA/CDA1 family)